MKIRRATKNDADEVSLYSTLDARGFYEKKGCKLRKEEIGCNDNPVRLPVLENKL